MIDHLLYNVTSALSVKICKYVLVYKLVFVSDIFNKMIAKDYILFEHQEIEIEITYTIT